MNAGRSMEDANGAVRVLILVLGAAVIFAGFINNKVPVYMPHLLIGFALAAGVAVAEAVSFVPAAIRTVRAPISALDSRAIGAAVFIGGYGLAGVFYYEKWYSTVRKSELV